MPPSTHTIGTAHVSGTRQRTYAECARKYWWQYNKFVKVNGPETDAHRLGKLVHWLAENYIRDGIEPDVCPDPPAEILAPIQDPKERALLWGRAKKIFYPGKVYWPRGRGVQAESPFSVSIPERPGEVYTGTMDVWDEGASAEIVARWPGQMRVDLGRAYGRYDLPVVGDHKTTKDEKYIKSVDELSRDEQLLGYGMEALRRTGAPAVCFQWIYYLTTGEPRAFPVRFCLSAEVLRREWNALEKIAQEMVDVVQIGNYRDVIANKAACSNYGGCYYRPLCRAEGDAMQDAKIWSKLNRPAAAATSPAALPEAPEVVAVLPAQVNPPAIAPRFRRPEVVAAAPLPAPALPPAPMPPPSPSPSPAPILALEVAPATLPSALPSALPAALPAAPPAASPAKRGRPKKNDLPAPEIVDVPAPVSIPTFDGAGSGFVLLVDCGLDKGGHGQQIAELFQPAMQKAAEANQQPNWRFIPYVAAAALAAAVDEQIDAAPISGFVRLDTHTPEGAALLPLLAARAFLVVRGYA